MRFLDASEVDTERTYDKWQRFVEHGWNVQRTNGNGLFRLLSTKHTMTQGCVHSDMTNTNSKRCTHAYTMRWRRRPIPSAILHAILRQHCIYLSILFLVWSFRCSHILSAVQVKRCLFCVFTLFSLFSDVAPNIARKDTWRLDENKKKCDTKRIFIYLKMISSR